MNADRSSRLTFGTAALALTAGLLLGACIRDTPEALVQSAQEYLARKDYQAASIQLKNALQKQESGQVLYLLASSLIGLGDYASAELHLRRALELKYSPDAIYPELATALLGLNKFSELLRELGEANAKEPAAQASLRSAVGEAFLALGQPKEARQAFAAALAAVPGHARARIGEAQAVAVRGDVQAAARVADEILAASPGMPEALSLKADLLLSAGKSEEAAKLLSELLKVAPYNGQARFTLISILISGEKLDEAAAQIAAMRKALPRDARRLYLEAVLAFRRGEPAKARDAIIQVLNLIPDHGPSLLLAGAAEYQLGSFSTAEDHLRKVLARYPNSLYARNLLVATLLRKGQPAKAEEAIAPALKIAPKDATVLRAAGEVAFANNRLADAARFYEQALATEKDNALLQTRLAQIRLAAGETQRALEDLEKASGLDSKQYQADLSIITAHLRQRNYDKALAAAAVLEKKQPANPLTHNVKGAVYAAKQDARNARASFEKALALQFNYLPAASNLARLDLADKKPEEAKKRFQMILAKEPNNDGAHLALAQVLVLSGAPRKEVTEAFERAVGANPSSVLPHLALINFHARNSDPKAALAAAQKALARLPEDPRILDALGLAQLADGQFNEAIEVFNKLARMQPDSPLPQMRLAAAQAAAKQIDAPIQALKKALALKPDLLEAQRQIIVAQLAAGRPDEALKDAKAVQKARPKEAIGFALEGDVLASQKKFAEAARMYAEGIKRQPVPSLVVTQHQLLLASGKTAEADALASKWLRENPKDHVVRFYLATASAQRKDHKAAAERFREILELQPDHAATLNNLAWVLGELKDPAALGYAEKAYAKAPSDPDVQDTYGSLLLEKGEVKRGVELLAQAAKGAPKSVEVRMHLAKALMKSGDRAGARRQLEAVVKLGENSPLGAEAAQLLRSL